MGRGEDAAAAAFPLSATWTRRICEVRPVGCWFQKPNCVRMISCRETLGWGILNKKFTSCVEYETCIVPARSFAPFPVSVVVRWLFYASSTNGLHSCYSNVPWSSRLLYLLNVFDNFHRPLFYSLNSAWHKNINKSKRQLFRQCQAIFRFCWGNKITMT